MRTIPQAFQLFAACDDQALSTISRLVTSTEQVAERTNISLDINILVQEKMTLVLTTFSE